MRAASSRPLRAAATPTVTLVDPNPNLTPHPAIARWRADRQTIEDALSQTTDLRFVNLGWTDKELVELANVLPFLTLRADSLTCTRGGRTLSRLLPRNPL